LTDAPYPHWHAVYTGVGQEELADHYLAEAGYATFLPMERVRRRQYLPHRRDNWRPRIVRIPHFPRYLFVALREGEPLGGIKGCWGVKDVVNIEGRPLLIRGRVMDDLRARTRRDPEDEKKNNGVWIIATSDRTRRPILDPGQAVAFVGSAFDGRTGEVHIDDGDELRVWLTVFDRRISVKCDPDAVEAVRS